MKRREKSRTERWRLTLQQFFCEVLLVQASFRMFFRRCDVVAGPGEKVVSSLAASFLAAGITHPQLHAASFQKDITSSYDHVSVVMRSSWFSAGCQPCNDALPAQCRRSCANVVKEIAVCRSPMPQVVQKLWWPEMSSYPTTVGRRAFLAVGVCAGKETPESYLVCAFHLSS